MIRGLFWGLLISVLFWLFIGYMGVIGYRWMVKDQIAVEASK